MTTLAAAAGGGGGGGTEDRGDERAPVQAIEALAIGDDPGRAPLPETASLDAAFVKLKRGVRVLKSTTTASSHWRVFKLSGDCKSITWNSKGAEREIKVTDVKRIEKGSKSGNKKFPLLFTTTDRTIEVACSNSEDQEDWLKAVEYLIANPNFSDRHSSGSFSSSGMCDVYTWGFGGFGQLGQGNTSDCRNPSIIKSVLGKEPKLIASGLEHLVVVTDGGTMYGWGNNGSSRLSGKTSAMAVIDEFCDTAGNNAFVPSSKAGLNSLCSKPKVSLVTCGDYHSMAIVGGEVYAWGANTFGQLGLGEGLMGDQATPRKVDTFDASSDSTFAIGVACGGMFSTALAEDGAFYTWGCNSEGQLGHGDRNDRWDPTIVNALSDGEMPVRDVAVGDEFIAVVAGASESLFTWGSNVCGQLGHGDFGTRLHPTLVQQVGAVSKIAAGSAHVCAVIEIEAVGKALHTWGCGTSGQLGHGVLGESNLSSPRKVDSNVLNERPITSMSCGANHTVVVVGEDLFAWGNNEWGQLGTGASSDGSAGANLGAVAGRKHSQITKGNVAAHVVNEPRAVVFKDKDGKSIKKPVHAVDCGGRFTAALVSRAVGSKGWIGDEETATCLNPLCKGNRLGKPAVFNMFTRRHHCRNCGGVFCDACSEHRIKLDMLGYTKKVRVCNDCKELFVKGIIW
jgi:alpha-tubulin suppressor-like RCC1 family protein